VLRMDDDGETVHFAPIARKGQTPSSAPSSGSATTSSPAAATTCASTGAPAGADAAAPGSARSVQADLIILATGYRQRFPFLDTSNSSSSSSSSVNEGDEHGGLPAGQRVILQGLKSRSDLNGSTGVVASAPRDDGRCVECLHMYYICTISLLPPIFLDVSSMYVCSSYHRIASFFSTAVVSLVQHMYSSYVVYILYSLCAHSMGVSFHLLHLPTLNVET